MTTYTIKANETFFKEVSDFNPNLATNLKNKYGWTDILVKRRDYGSLSQRSGQRQRVKETSFNSKN
jgi:hypothetical protein|tara:strand:- start:40 stop:237 length:198 start_codon:yes stop_codon:yes gene_type:complete